MKTKGKRIIIISACLFSGGIVLTILGMLFGGRPGFNISRDGFQSASRYEEPHILEKTKLSEFSNAAFSLDYANVEILSSEDNNYYLEYKLNGSEGKPAYDVKGDTFKFTQTEDHISFVSFGFSSIDDLTGKAYVRLYVPKDAEFGTLNIENESGEFLASDLKADALEVNMDYGKCNISDSDFNSLFLTMESGNANIKNTRAGDFQFDGQYGDIELKEFSSDYAYFNLESTDVYLDAAKLGDLEYSNEYGELVLRLPDKLENYTFDIAAEYGEIKLPNDAPKGLRSDREDSMEYYETEGKGDHTIEIATESGDIDIRQR